MKPEFRGRPGDTILTSTPNNPTRHLWIILAITDNGKLLSVNLMDSENTHENTVILNKGDHPFVSKPTAIKFSAARELDPQKIQDAISNGMVIPHFPISPELLEEAKRGFLASPYFPESLKRKLRLSGNLPPQGDY